MKAMPNKLLQLTAGEAFRGVVLFLHSTAQVWAVAGGASGS